MSRNRCDTVCKCGRQLQLSDCVSRPLNFDEYLKAIDKDPNTYGYYYEYEDLIGAKAICPNCQRQYLIWLNRNNGAGHFDTSYWHSFNDEPCSLCREVSEQ